MIRKSVWLFSAGLIAISAPGLAQPATQSTTDPTQPSKQPTQGETANAAAVQTQAVERQPVDTGDIVITATRRNQALSDVPMAVSAVTADTLRNSGATDIRQLDQVSPSLLVSSTTSEGGAAVARIRGIGTVGDNPGLEGSVATYIDGVYRSRTGVALVELGPLDRIEVLRGPQGTLFGRNASAGVISVITAKPQFTPFVAGAVSIGNYDFRRLEASLNAPLGDTVAARIDGVYVKRDGFLKDVISGRRINDRDRFLVRGQLLFQPNDRFNLRLIADYSQQNEECCGAVYLPAHNFVAGLGATPSSFAAYERSLGAIIEDNPYKRLTSITPGRSYNSDVKDGGLSAEINYDLGGVNLTSITAYRTNKYVGAQDNDYNNLDILYRDGNGGFANKFNTFTQEVRFQGKALGGRLDWLVGGFYANEQLTRKDDLAFGADADLFFRGVIRASSPALAAFPGYNYLNLFAQGFLLNQLTTNPLLASVPSAAYPLVIGTIAGQVANTPLSNTGERDTFKQDGTNYALFTHNIFKITDRLSLTLGARYTVDHKKLSADLASTSQCAAYLANITRLQQLAAAAAGNPTGNSGLNPAIAALSNALASQVLAQLTLPPCGVINSINGHFSGGRENENKLSGTAVLSYKPTDQLLTYVSYSRGYKAGGFNLDRTALTASAVNLNDLRFKPELVDAYELGAKFNGHWIDVNLALFDEEFKNFQLNTFNGVNFVVENINSCSSSLGGADTDYSASPVACSGSARPGVRSRGIEVETFFRPIREVNGALGLTYADTRYRHDLIGTNGDALAPAFFQLPGRRISNAPALTLTGSLGYTPAIGGGMHALFYADARHTSTYNTGSDLDIEKTQKPFTVVNARVGVRGPDDSWSVELWAQNLFNTKYEQVAFDAPLQGSGTQRGVEAGFYPASTQLYGAFLGEPRTFGVTLRGKIGWNRPAPPPPYVAPPAPPPPAPIIEQPAAPPPPPPPAPTERGERG